MSLYCCFNCFSATNNEPQTTEPFSDYTVATDSFLPPQTTTSEDQPTDAQSILDVPNIDFTSSFLPNLSSGILSSLKLGTLTSSATRPATPPTAVITLDDSDVGSGDEGGGTPVQDEKPEKPEPQPAPIPRMVNPIEFLNQLLSQKKKENHGGGSTDFLQSLSVLTKSVQSQAKKLDIPTSPAEVFRTESDATWPPEPPKPPEPAEESAFQYKFKPFYNADDYLPAETVGSEVSNSIGGQSVSHLQSPVAAIEQNLDAACTAALQPPPMPPIYNFSSTSMINSVSEKPFYSVPRFPAPYAPTATSYMPSGADFGFNDKLVAAGNAAVEAPKPRPSLAEMIMKSISNNSNPDVCSLIQTITSGAPPPPAYPPEHGIAAYTGARSYDDNKEFLERLKKKTGLGPPTPTELPSTGYSSAAPLFLGGLSCLPTTPGGDQLPDRSDYSEDSSALYDGYGQYGGNSFENPAVPSTIPAMLSDAIVSPSGMGIPIYHPDLHSGLELHQQPPQQPYDRPFCGTDPYDDVYRDDSYDDVPMDLEPAFVPPFHPRSGPPMGYDRGLRLPSPSQLRQGSAPYGVRPSPPPFSPRMPPRPRFQHGYFPRY